MTLLQALSAAKSEEDVKDAYGKAIDLKKYSKGWVDIQTDNMWGGLKKSSSKEAVCGFSWLSLFQQ